MIQDQQNPMQPASYRRAEARADGRVAVYQNGVLLGERDVSAWPQAGAGGYVGVWLYHAGESLLDDFAGGNGAALPAPRKDYSLSGERVAERQGEQVFYLSGDPLGSLSLVTDASGAAVSQGRYGPFGEGRWGSGASPTDFGYTGQRDDGTGLLDYHARFYDPVLGRFISPDSLIPDPGNPLDWDRYAYVENNPINSTDPSGHRVLRDCNTVDCVGYNPSQSYNIVSDNLFASPLPWNQLPGGYQAALQHQGVTEEAYSLSEWAGKPGFRDAYVYEDPATLFSMGGGAALRAGIAYLIRTVIGLETADCATDGQCAATQFVDDVIQFGERSLRHAYDRHYADWGLPQHRTPAMESAFRQLIIDQINGETTRVILGFFRGQDAIHFFDPVSGRDVITTLEGAFIGAWRLTVGQISRLLINGRW